MTSGPRLRRLTHRTRRRRQIVVHRDLPTLTLIAIRNAVQAAYPRSEVIVRRPGILGDRIMVTPWDKAIVRDIEQLVDAATGTAP
jgi:hypothetical protein